MERILLVEPNYKNKYPPIGLMKISTYYKAKGDYVVFHKGLMPKNEVETYDKILITTLFTFDFDMCIDTIRYYIEIAGLNRVFVGGIALTIMPKRFLEAIPGLHILEGQLTTSKRLGYDDDINIDILELDYDMLWDISYQYPAADSYFIYTSRGCPRKCSFCAVKTLEPFFYECNNVKEQILRVDQKFGAKKQLLIMDNNALHADNLVQTIDVLVELGFGVNNNTIKKNNNMQYLLQSLKARIKEGRSYESVLGIIRDEYLSIKTSRISGSDCKRVLEAQKVLQDDESFITYLDGNHDYIIDFFSRYHYHSIKRYVDFNQGLDARLFTEEKARILSRIALKPCRIAFDDIAYKDVYFEAIQNAVSGGIKHFSNYLLYNYNDKPCDLWKRLFLNVEFCENNRDVASLFSFPMKYASIEHTDRSYIGKHWNKKYLKSMNVILNVTSGVVAKEKDFFVRAFGKTEQEFIEILTMPDDYIRYREYFEQNGLIPKWREQFRSLSEENKKELIELLSNCEKEIDLYNRKHSEGLDNILKHYIVKKSKMENNMAYFLRMLNERHTV